MLRVAAALPTMIVTFDTDFGNPRAVAPSATFAHESVPAAAIGAPGARPYAA
jgi:hypothetical protein